jgi:hypothetical protein
LWSLGTSTASLTERIKPITVARRRMPMAGTLEPTNAGQAVPEPASTGDAPRDLATAHRSAQRRLLFGIELTLFGLVLVVASPGNAQVGVLVAAFGLVLGLTGL